MPLTPAALQLAGFLMAHAFWITADLPPGQHYVPQALCENSRGERRMVTFDAPTPAEQIEKARVFLGSTGAQFSECVLSRQTAIDGPAGPVDVLAFDLFSGADNQLTVLQAFRPPHPEAAPPMPFRLRGLEVLFTVSGGLPRGMADQTRDGLREGATDHPGTEEKWAAWNADREPETPIAK
ncbi:hypothetical protein [Novosphingobium sp.]|uniref:hypothetical protein n=1 Tax=Novosphingobium sp. TaxID=1874826 RepID=UPI0025D8F9D8|nr:hypothetical protein [Novosphingobium sp.]